MFDGTVRVHTTKHKPFEHRWDKPKFEATRGIPVLPDPKLPGLHIPVHIRPANCDVNLTSTKVRDIETVPREMYLYKI